MEPEPPGAAFFTLEPEPESAPGPWPPGAGAAQKSGGSATLIYCQVTGRIRAALFNTDPDSKCKHFETSAGVNSPDLDPYTSIRIYGRPIICPVLRIPSRSFLAGAGADLKFDLDSEQIFWGRLRLLLLASEKRNDLRMFVFLCELYTFIYKR